MSISVAVAGATGYAGGEVLRLLLDHADARIGALTAGSSAGQRLGTLHPHLWPLADREVLATDAAVLAEHDAVVLALPHGASAEVTEALEELDYDGVVLDCGADHRLTDPADWERWYAPGADVPFPGAWTYGMPELLVADGEDVERVARRQRAELAQTRRVAVPGCNVTAVTLALQPGVAAGLVDTGDIVATLSVGYSGAGAAAKRHLLASEALGSMAAYGTSGKHRHVPEIRQNLRRAGAQEVRTSFTPVLVPSSRGILAVVTAPLAPAHRGTDPEDLRAALRSAWKETYGAEELIHLLPAGTWPTVASVSGSAAAAVQVDLDPDAGPHGRVLAVCALDNLGKGTAAAAVQSLNLALGLPETSGLSAIGVAP